MFQKLNPKVVELAKDFHSACVRENTLIQALNVLFYPHSASAAAGVNDDLAFARQFWNRLDAAKDAILYSLTGLERCFHEEGSEALRRILGELEERKHEALPGVIFHIALALFWYKMKAPLDDDKSVEIILREGILDAIQDPLLERHFGSHYEIITHLLGEMDLRGHLYENHYETWQLLDRVIKSSLDGTTKDLWRAMFALLRATENLQAPLENQHREDVMGKYLQAHPETIDTVIASSFSKNFALMKQFRSIPLLWHLAFLDQWIHKQIPIPLTLLRTLAWLNSGQRVHFINFCFNKKECNSYLRMLTSQNDSQLLSMFLDDYVSLDKNLKTYSNKLIYLARIFSSKGLLQHKTIVEALQFIDQHRPFFLSDRSDILVNLAVRLLNIYPFRDVYENRFSEIHGTLRSFFRHQSTSRSAYLALLYLKLRIKSPADLDTVIDLLKRRFDAEQYQLSLEDVASILYHITKNDIANLFHDMTSGYEHSNDKTRKKLEAFYSAFLELSADVLPALEKDKRESVVNWLYRFSVKAGGSLTHLIANRLKKTGIGSPFFYRDDILVLAFLNSDSSEEEAATESRTEGEYKASKAYRNKVMEHVPYRKSHRSWHVDIILKWRQINEEHLETVGFIPFIYHPSYGYGFFFIESDRSFLWIRGIRAPLVVLFSKHIPYEGLPLYKVVPWSKKLKLVILEQNDEAEIQHQKAVLEPYIKNTLLYHASIAFVRAKAFTGLHQEPHKVLIDTNHLFNALTNEYNDQSWRSYLSF